MKSWNTTALVCLLLASGACASWYAGALMLPGEGAARRQAAEAARVREADRQRAALVTRLAVREQVIDRLLTGRLNLLEAASWFHHLNHQPPVLEDRCLASLPGDTEEERVCRQVISWVSAVVALNQSAEGELVVGALEDELARELQAHGRPVLPDLRSVEQHFMHRGGRPRSQP